MLVEHSQCGRGAYMKPVIDHIHVTVADLERAERFYDRLLPLLGFDLANKERNAVPEHEYAIVEYHHSSFSFGIVSPRSAYTNETISRRKPGALHHLAFHADSRAEVDRLYLQVKALGAEIVHEPRLYPEYCKDYYAFFFKDSESIEYEIVHFDRADYFPL
jgi:catechol 2,3-dioxygenase-like lactoylglutathione lyase family enzyme